MSYTFAYSVEDGLLVVRLGGARPALDVEMVERHLEMFETAARLCRENSLRRLLFLNEVPGRLTSSAALGLFARIGDFGLDRGLRIAVFVNDPDNRPIVQFGANVAIRDGWAVQVFETEDDARAWLLNN